MASGLPVVAAESEVTRELLGAGAGSFYTPGDTHALASHIARWGRDAALRRIAGVAGRRAAGERRWSRVFDALFHDYHCVLSGGSLVT